MDSLWKNNARNLSLGLLFLLLFCIVIYVSYDREPNYNRLQTKNFARLFTKLQSLSNFHDPDSTISSSPDDNIPIDGLENVQDQLTFDKWVDQGRSRQKVNIPLPWDEKVL